MTEIAIAAKSTRKERMAWYFYDFGNSAYAAVVLLAIYSAYFQGVVVGGAEGSRLWGLSVGVAMLVVAIISPFLGSLADFSGTKKRFLFFFTALSCLFTAGLFFAEEGSVAIGMGFFILAEIGYRSAQVFYNGLLPEIAAPEEIGRISGNGWAIGTAGGVVCLLIILPLVVMIDSNFIIRLSMVITAVFFAASAVPIFLWLPERAERRSLPAGASYFTLAIKELRDTFNTTKEFKEFLKFMLAFLVYNDGVIMALDFAAIIGAVLYGLDQTGLIIFVILVQVTNVIGAYIFGHVVDKYGSKRALALSILVMIGGVIWLYFNRSLTVFYIIGGIAGIGMAGIQSISRTMVALFSPPGKSAKFYGMFAVTGRTSSFIGPAVYGWIAADAAIWYQKQGQSITLAEQSGQRLAILSIAIFLFVGLLLLWQVNETKGAKESKA